MALLIASHPGFWRLLNRYMELATRGQYYPEKCFAWRDSSGTFHDIARMETRHLFNVLVMIWNHTMPDDAKTHDYKRYSFSAFYAPRYMQSAIKAILPELSARLDVTFAQAQRLEKMAAYFKENQPLLEAVE